MGNQFARDFLRISRLDAEQNQLGIVRRSDVRRSLDGNVFLHGCCFEEKTVAQHRLNVFRAADEIYACSGTREHASEVAPHRASAHYSDTRPVLMHYPSILSVNDL